MQLSRALHLCAQKPGLCQNHVPSRLVHSLRVQGQQPGVVTQASNPSPLEAQAGDFL